MAMSVDKVPETCFAAISRQAPDEALSREIKLDADNGLSPLLLNAAANGTESQRLRVVAMETTVWPSVAADGDQRRCGLDLET